jgi:hypothetical protein
VPVYDRTFTPPAPVAGVIVVHPLGGTRSDVLRGKLDTGADLTVIPERVIAQLRITPKGRIWTRGYDGTYTQRALYYVRMVVEDFDVPTVDEILTQPGSVTFGPISAAAANQDFEAILIGDCNLSWPSDASPAPGTGG